MSTIAYLANLFPSSVEPYVGDEIEELRSRGIRVIAASVRRAELGSRDMPRAKIVLQPLPPLVLVRALWLCLRRWRRMQNLIGRVVFAGRESPLQRAKALLHTWLGACYAILLEPFGVDHIHVHHGYFGSWIAMVAAQLLGTGFSLTLHGSDLLVQGAYLDTKLKACSFCLTISEFNRRYILERYPQVAAEKVFVSRLGVEVPDSFSWRPDGHESRRLKLLSVGRLQAVKNHPFLIRACAELQKQGIDFECWIAGDGPERNKLATLIGRCGLGSRIELLGHVARERMSPLYEHADIVVLTSHSEGIPLVLMEAMARRNIVLAPAITGIPELVIPGQTGFLYQAGSLEEFVDRLLFIHSLLTAQQGVDSTLISVARQLDWIRYAAQVQVRHNFNRTKNLRSFADLFLSQIVPAKRDIPHANLVLQQI